MKYSGNNIFRYKDFLAPEYFHNCTEKSVHLKKTQLKLKILTLLFLLITYSIIEKLYDNLSGVNTNICKIVALFFADDGMILMQSLRETKESIQVLMNIAFT